MSVMSMKYISFLFSCMVLFGCGSQAPPDVSRNSVDLVSTIGMQTFPNASVARSVNRSNADIAQEFLELGFALESGQNITHLTRFDGPIFVAITPTAPKRVVQELDRLIARLRSEAGLNIRRSTGKTANIYVETLPKKQLQKAIPTAACFVVPNVSGWSDYRRNRFKNLVDWTRLEERKHITVFMPSDVSPQETRDCLHEEIAQALGPVNDLYRLPDSVYNDDNFNISLTAYDMLILEAYYAPEIRNGMSKEQVASVLPQILARLNPIGQTLPPVRLQPTSRDWARSIETALGPRTSNSKRRSAAFRAIKIAKARVIRITVWDFRILRAHKYHCTMIRVLRQWILRRLMRFSKPCLVCPISIQRKLRFKWPRFHCLQVNTILHWCLSTIPYLLPVKRKMARFCSAY